MLALFACATPATPGFAADGSGPRLAELDLCSVYETPRPQHPKEFCYVEPVEPGEHETPSTVSLSLTATTSPIEVGGYRVVTENYNGTYLPPVVELGAGDTLKVHLLNSLAERRHEHDGEAEDHVLATNLHTHGWIVPPKNATNPERGNGDNIFVSLKRGEWLDYNISIPVRLPASLLDGEIGEIQHPHGPFWYHSHLHGLSEGQVAGGMSGMMSVGPQKANILALSGKDADTNLLRLRTDAAYLMLRDIQLRSDTPPDKADGTTPATWIRASGQNPCYPENVTEDALPAAPDREGYCVNPADQPERIDSIGPVDPTTPAKEAEGANIWLFTVNGQRFPTIEVPSGRNALLRIGNLSANVTYVLSFEPDKENGRKRLQFDLISVDGVVPAPPSSAAALAARGGIGVKSTKRETLVLMPAARAEILLRNDGGDTGKDVIEGAYVLRTAEQCTNVPPKEGKPVDISDIELQCDDATKDQAENGLEGDHWPEIQLAKIVFQPKEAAYPDALELALNAPVSEIPEGLQTAVGLPAAEPLAAGAAGLGATRDLPEGCLPDINKRAGEYRRVSFGAPLEGKWRVRTEIVRPPSGEGPFRPDQFQPVPDASTPFVSFEEFLVDGQVDWSGVKTLKHPCVKLGDGTPLSSGHNQIWEIANGTTELHNFHIHQMKFRLARPDELKDYGIDPTAAMRAFANPPLKAIADQGIWHDTLPIPRGPGVFIIMNFDAAAQLGKFVYHCHILEHEDDGLMTPMEVIR